MPITLLLPVGMTFGIITWTLFFAWYVHPALSKLPFATALRPLLLLHAFRYIGLMFLIPGVTAEALDVRFASPAAYGDLIAALLALGSLALLPISQKAGLVAVWIFNVWGLADLFNAVVRGLQFTPDGALGAAFWIPLVIVPLLVVCHLYIFGRLWAESSGIWRRSLARPILE